MPIPRANLLHTIVFFLDHRGLHPDDIAHQLGCHRATVYSILRRPRPGRRYRRPGRDDHLLHLFARVLQETIRPTPTSTQDQSSAEAPPASDPDAGPYADLADPDYVAAARTTGDPELILTRAAIRKLYRQLDDPTLDPAVRARLTAHLPALAGLVHRVLRAAPESFPDRAGMSRVLDQFARTLEE